MPFDKALYLSEMQAMVEQAIARIKQEYPDYQVYTASIWTDPNAGASAISFDSKAYSDQQVANSNDWLRKQHQRLLEAGDVEQAKLYEPTEGRNTNPADFEFSDFAETQHQHLELNWEAESDGECWDVLEPALLEVGNISFTQILKLNTHPDLELAVNGRNDWYEFTWQK